MIDKYSATWQAIDKHLTDLRLELSEKLIKKDDDQLRGKINLIDDLLGLASPAASPQVEQINYFQD